jgi:hypothetical protein
VSSGNGKRSTSSPERRYEEFAKENRAWDRKVKHSIEKIGKTRRSTKREAAR